MDETTLRGDGPEIVVHGDRETRIAMELGYEIGVAERELGLQPLQFDLREAARATALARILARYLPPEPE